MKKFLQWLLVVCTTIVGAGFAYQSGLVTEIYQTDSSKICLITALLFLVGTLYVGVQTLRDKAVEFGWFISAQLLNLGLFGTIVGMIQMLTILATADVQAAGTTQKLSGAMSIALYTTAVGLVTSLPLKLQCYIADKK